ncbi:membrane protein [Brucella suis 1330]|nr:membrane protein [Brucella suis 1330]
MWYFSWLLGLPLAAAFAVLNAMWYELMDDRARKRLAPTPRRNWPLKATSTTEMQNGPETGRFTLYGSSIRIAELSALQRNHRHRRDRATW